MIDFEYCVSGVTVSNPPPAELIISQHKWCRDLGQERGGGGQAPKLSGR